jgi:hypothetical protein
MSQPLMKLTSDKDLVQDADNMSSKEFSLHMTHRHHDSLGGLKYLPDNLGDYVEECYRIFHDRLHATRVDLEHEHARDYS